MADGVGIAPTQPGGSLGFQDRGITATATSRCSWDAAGRSPSARWSRPRRCRARWKSSTPKIPGDGSTTQEVAISGHLYEGYIKQGANDDNSGCALTLEVGRAYLKLIAEGKLPKPKRTINFQWVPEISGTNAWLNAHPEKEKAIVGDLNFDMEGIRLDRQPQLLDPAAHARHVPSYLNDIGQSMMEYVSELTRERVRFRANGYAPSVRQRPTAATMRSTSRSTSTTARATT